MSSVLHAYLDPGSGSLLLQVILGGSAAFMVVLRLGWRSVCSRFSRRPIEPVAASDSSLLVPHARGHG
jgi:hypothetical protein